MKPSSFDQHCLIGEDWMRRELLERHRAVQGDEEL